MDKNKLEEWMDVALALAQDVIDEIPVAAIVINPAGEIIGRGVNTRAHDKNPFGHAEMNAIADAAQHLGNWRLDEMTLVVTLEPCSMCAGAIAQTRISRLVFGAWDEKAGAVGSLWDLLRDPRAIHQVEVFAGIQEEACSEMLGNFFRTRR
jgi:tRNA(adenine34) deaminase